MNMGERERIIDRQRANEIFRERMERQEETERKKDVESAREDE